MPLAEMPRGVAGLLKCPCNRGGLRVKPVAFVQLPLLLAGIEIGIDVLSRGKLSGEDSHSGWRADGGGVVRLGETHALGCEAIDVRRLNLSAVAAQIGEAHVVDKDLHDIGAV